MPRLLSAAMIGVLALLGCEDAIKGPTTGDLSVEISGLPAGASGVVTLTGPNGFTRTLSGSETIPDLKPGDYTIVAGNVTVGNVVYAAAEERQQVTVALGRAQSVKVGYVNMNTTLTVTIRGLPAGRTTPVRITGPNGFDRTVTATTRLAGLPEGNYVITGAGLVVGDSTYQARPARQDYVMTGFYPGAADVTYAAVGHRSLNLRVSGMYLTNAVQNASGSIPLIENRDAYLRVFATADQVNTATPWVRVRIYDGLTVARTLYLSHEAPFVPTTSGEATLATSWNIVIPAALVKPTMRIDVEADPDNGVVEGNEGDNLFPAASGPQPVAVVSPAPLRLRLIPIQQTATGSVGGITESNKESYLGMTRKLFPIPAAIESEVRGRYVSTGPAIGSDVGPWATLLSELDALRTAEVGDQSPFHYVGLVRANCPPGTSCVAGVAYVPGAPVPGGTALVWDFLPSGDEVMAHELGHNFGRLHAPCRVGGDSQYPYAGGLIGVYGFDVVARRFRTPSDPDIMGYCNDPWISDYTYEAVRQFRGAAAGARRASQSSLIVWGRMDADGIVLEPAFQATTQATATVPGGAHTAVGLDASGATVFSIAFDGDRMADLPGDVRSFALAVPLTAEKAASIVAIRVRGSGREAVVRATGASAPARVGVGLRDQAFRLEPESGGLALSWDRNAHPLIVVRDAASGQILSFARGGRASLPGVRGAVELLISDGVRSVSRRVQAGAG